MQQKEFYETIIKIKEDVASIKTSVKDLKGSFDKLPCNVQSAKIETLETFRDEMKGKMTVWAVIGGFLGSIIMTMITWFLGKR